MPLPGLIPGLHPANERRRYKIMASLIWLGASLKSALHSWPICGNIFHGCSSRLISVSYCFPSGVDGWVHVQRQLPVLQRLQGTQVQEDWRVPVIYWGATSCWFARGLWAAPQCRHHVRISLFAVPSAAIYQFWGPAKLYDVWNQQTTFLWKPTRGWYPSRNNQISCTPKAEVKARQGSRSINSSLAPTISWSLSQNQR